MSWAQVLAAAAAFLACAGVAELLPRRRRAVSGRSVRGAAAVRALASAGARLRAGRSHAPRGVAARIAAAGYPAGLGTREVLAAKLAACGGGAGLGALLGAAAPGRLGILTALAAPALGFIAPDWWLARRASERVRRTRRELPAMLDLLRVTMASGGSLAASLAAVGERTSGPLADEWRRTARQVALGIPLRSALAEMPLRLPTPEIEALAATLDRALRHGAPPDEALAAQARDARLARRRRVQEEAAKAGPKMQLVVALLLVPSVLLMVAAALAAALLGGGGMELA